MNNRNYRLLLVDDNQKALDALKAPLTSKGFRCDCALTWQNALALAKRQTYDVVISAYRLPENDGVQLIQAIQQEKPTVAGLVISSFGDMGRVSRATRQADSISFVTRPCQDEKLLQAAEDAIQAGKSNKAPKPDSAVGGYLLDHKVYSHSAINDLECVYPGITQGVWDDADTSRFKRKGR